MPDGAKGAAGLADCRLLQYSSSESLPYLAPYDCELVMRDPRRLFTQTCQHLHLLARSELYLCLDP